MGTKIILFTGQIGSGKGFISTQKIQKLKEVGNTVLQISFADPIKKLVHELCFCDKNLVPLPFKECIQTNTLKHFTDVLFDRLNEDILEVAFLDRFMDFTANQMIIVEKLFELSKVVKTSENQEERKEKIRSMYQLFGTDLVQSFHKCVWAMYISNRIKQINKSEKIDYIIIEDFRFLMEYFSMITILKNYEFTVYAIIADIAVRAIRRNTSVTKLKEMSDHISEQEFSKVLLPWMKLCFPENIIENN